MVIKVENSLNNKSYIMKNNPKFIVLMSIMSFFVSTDQIFAQINFNYTIDGIIDFEDSLWGPFNQSINGTYSTVERTITVDPLDSTNLVAYHKIIYDNGTTYRSESMNSSFKVAPKTSYWYGARIMLPSDYSSDSKHEYVMQWHASADKDSLGNPLEPNRSPPLALETENGEWKIVYRWEPNHITTNVNQVNNINKIETSLGSYMPDLMKWIDWKFYVGWDYDGQGFLYVWKDTSLVLQLQNIPIGYNDDEGTYVKFGVYKAWWSTQPTDVNIRRVYHDNLWRGSPIILGLGEDMSNEQNLKVYPNPTSNILVIDAIDKNHSNQTCFNVYDANGILIFSKQLDSSKMNFIQVSDFPSGIYIFNYGLHSGKFIKQ